MATPDGGGYRMLLAYTGSRWGRLWEGDGSTNNLRRLPSKTAICMDSGGWTDIRSGPGSKYRRLGKVTRPTVKKVFEARLTKAAGKRSGQAWYRIKFKGRSGWVLNLRTMAYDAHSTTAPCPSVGPSVPEQPATPPPDSPGGPTEPVERKVIGYYPAWATYARDYQVADIPGEKVSHINYAFANISGGKCVLGDPYADVDKAFAGDTWDAGTLRGNFNQLIRLREKHPHLQTLISVGGWTWSENFSEVAATGEARAAFVDSCIDFMQTYQFDGIDVDWEYPVSGGLYPGNAQDKRNYTQLMEDFRAALDVEEREEGRDYWLSIATPVAPSTISNLEVGELADAVDWINVMSYDFHGGWNDVTGHNSPMFRGDGDPSPAGLSVSEAVQTYLSRGVPANKLVLGVAFNGRGWDTDGTDAAGLYQPGKGTSLGTWEPGTFDYTDLSHNYLPTMTRYWDEQAQVPYLFDAQRKLFITYDDPQSMRVKAEYINELGLGGAMLWELSGDRDQQLLDALNATLD